MEDDPAPEDTFRILIATDIHLGYSDSNPKIENDSFNTFEEILEIAHEENVDFVLLGGDLFHDNKPKPSTLKRTIEIFKKHCLGDRPVPFEYLGDPAKDFKGIDEPQVNYYSPNLNISMPVFTIHGNHDDPIGNRKTSAVDHLAAAGLLNHFGQVDNLNDIEISPLLFRKGNTKLSIHGLGNVKDERLFRAFRDHKVTFLREKEDRDSWFNVFVLHQNRVAHGLTSYIPPKFFPSFFDFVLWGHEHECRIEPEDELCGALDADSADVAHTEVPICQPGSSVATSLCPGEEVEKYVGILEIHRKTYRLIKKKLQTVRPMMFRDLEVAEVFKDRSHTSNPAKYLESYVKSKVQALIDDSVTKLTGHVNQPLEPLIRLRVFFEDENVLFNNARFSQQYFKTVANTDILAFKKLSKKQQGNHALMDAAQIHDFIMEDEHHDLEDHVEEIVHGFFTQGAESGEPGKTLEILSERGLSEAVKICASKSEKDAILAVVNTQLTTLMEHLQNKNVDNDNILEEIERFRSARLTQTSAEDERKAVLNAVKKFAADTSRDKDRMQTSTEDLDDDVEEVSVSLNVSTRGRGRGSRGGRAAASRASPSTRSRGRSRGRSAF